MTIADTQRLTVSRKRHFIGLPVTTRLWRSGGLASIGWALAAALTALVPDSDDFERTDLAWQLMAAVAAILVVAVVARATTRRSVPALTGTGPWLLALAIGLAIW